MHRHSHEVPRARSPVRSMHVTPLWVALHLQTEELLVKRRNLLEKKIEQETERAKEFTRSKNKRGAVPRPSP